jgi:hypothetical protein
VDSIDLSGAFTGSKSIGPSISSDRLPESRFQTDSRDPPVLRQLDNKENRRLRWQFAGCFAASLAGLRAAGAFSR